MSLRDVVNKYNNIIIISGAGVSTESGIDDYKSKPLVLTEDGDVLSYYDIMSRDYANNNKDEFNQYISKLKDELVGKSKSSAHLFANYLESVGKLCGVITQNIDGLYDVSNLVEIHGSLLKDNVVLYGDSYDSYKVDIIHYWLRQCDCIIVMGTALEVSFIHQIVASSECPKYLINRELVVLDEYSYGLYSGIVKVGQSDKGWSGVYLGNFNDIIDDELK